MIQHVCPPPHDCVRRCKPQLLSDIRSTSLGNANAHFAVNVSQPWFHSRLFHTESPHTLWCGLLQFELPTLSVLQREFCSFWSASEVGVESSRFTLGLWRLFIGVPSTTGKAGRTCGKIRFLPCDTMSLVHGKYPPWSATKNNACFVQRCIAPLPPLCRREIGVAFGKRKLSCNCMRHVQTHSLEAQLKKKVLMKREHTECRDFFLPPWRFVRSGIWMSAPQKAKKSHRASGELDIELFVIRAHIWGRTWHSQGWSSQTWTRGWAERVDLFFVILDKLVLQEVTWKRRKLTVSEHVSLSVSEHTNNLYVKSNSRRRSFDSFWRISDPTFHTSHKDENEVPVLTSVFWWVHFVYLPCWQKGMCLSKTSNICFVFGSWAKFYSPSTLLELLEQYQLHHLSLDHSGVCFCSTCLHVKISFFSSSALGHLSNGCKFCLHQGGCLQGWVQLHQKALLENLLGSHWGASGHSCWGPDCWSGGECHHLTFC